MVGNDTLLNVEPAYKNVLRARLAVTWATLLAAALAVRFTIWREGPYGDILPIAIGLLALLVIFIAPNRIYRRLCYRLDPSLLQVVRGWLLHTDTIVPLVRVQHIDVIRGPFDKAFGTASLVVHTAGTLNSVVTLPGLAPQQAAGMRDIIREQIRTDHA